MTYNVTLKRTNGIETIRTVQAPSKWIAEALAVVEHRNQYNETATPTWVARA